MVETVIRQISIEPFNISNACPNALDGTPLVQGGALVINIPRVLPLAPVSLVGHAHTLVASVAVEPDWAQRISDQMRKSGGAFAPSVLPELPSVGPRHALMNMKKDRIVQELGSGDQSDLIKNPKVHDSRSFHCFMELYTRPSQSIYQSLGRDSKLKRGSIRIRTQ